MLLETRGWLVDLLGGWLTFFFFYLTVTRHDIMYVMGLVNQFMHKSKWVHWCVTLQIVAYIKKLS